MGKAWRNETAQSFQGSPMKWGTTPLSPSQSLVTLLEAAIFLGCVVYGLGYPRPREELQSDFWDPLRPEDPLGKWQIWG